MNFIKGVKEVEIEGEVVYLKKSFLGWGVVHPIKINNKINWKNLIAGGNWIKLLMIIIFVFICIGAIFEVKNLYEIANKCLSSPISIWNS